MLAEPDSDVTAFYLEEEYLCILDNIVDEAISSVPFPSMIVPEIIKRLVVFSDESKERLKKRDCWIKHFIESYYNDAQKMCFLIEALTEISIAQAAEYIALLINCTKNYDIFEAIPLTLLRTRGLEALCPCIHRGLKIWKSSCRSLRVLITLSIRIEYNN